MVAHLMSLRLVKLVKMALDMDRDAEGILKHEVCFADGNHKRCLGYITLTLWVRINLQ